jgi:N-acetylglucosamine kinase-like BadF-type ATPase
MRYYLGLDAGGTKTHCLVGNSDGVVLGFGKAGTGNYEGYGVEAADVEIRKAVKDALESAGIKLSDIAGIGMGIAGADVPEDYEMLDREIFRPLFGEIPRVFRNDSMAGLRGGTREPYGIVIACGTGCVCAGVNTEGKESRVGGINEYFGDAVSGSSIGLEGLKCVWRARDGIIPPTRMTEKFLHRAQCSDIEGFFYVMYREEKTFADLEPMAPLVFEAAAEGDEAACGILEWGGDYLADMVNAVARHLEMTRKRFHVVMAGSVFKGASPVLRDAMITRIHRQCPDAECVMPVFEPVVGGLLLGMELDGTITEPVYQSLGESLAEVGTRYNVRFKSE